MVRVLAVLAALALGSPGADVDASGDADLETLVASMSGSFSSRQESLEASGYFDIRLEVARIWPFRKGHFWLYVEQASAETLDRPYRQRIYRVGRRSDDLLESAVAELPDPSTFVGAWREPGRFDSLAVADLRPREGCTALLDRWADGRFEGSLEGTGCRSGLRGASRATSEVVVDANVLKSWDRGYREDGTQAWGAEAGPYVFRRVDARAVISWVDDVPEVTNAAP